MDFYSSLIPKDNCLIVGSALDPDVSLQDKILLFDPKLRRNGFDSDKSLKRSGVICSARILLNKLITDWEELHWSGRQYRCLLQMSTIIDMSVLASYKYMPAMIASKRKRFHRRQFAVPRSFFRKRTN
jgi:hypothetical protein